MYGIVVGLVGLVFLFFGLKYHKTILFLLGFSLATYGSRALAMWLVPTLATEHALWLGWVLPGVVGLLAGWLLLQGWKLGCLLVGAVGGLLVGALGLGLVLPMAGLRDFFFEGTQAGLWKGCWLAACAAAGLLAVHWLERWVIMGTTSLIGAGCMCAAADAFGDTHFHVLLRQCLAIKWTRWLTDKTIGSSTLGPEDAGPLWDVAQLRQPAYLGNVIALLSLTLVGFVVQLKMSGYMKALMQLRHGDRKSYQHV